jgi:LysR family transcriptional regulator, chromosome initiation inhibitor
MDLERLRALAAVVETGTFDAAARALHVTPSALSQRIKALEVATGQVLLVRARPVTPTEPGRVLLRLARQVDLLTGDALRSLGRPGPLVLPIAVNADSLATWVLPALAPLAGTVCFDLRRADQRRTSDLLRGGEVMAAVTTEAAPVPGCRSTPLGTMTYRPAAARSFAARWFPAGVNAEALRAAPVVVFDRDDELQDAYLRRWDGAVPPRHWVPGSAEFLDAVRRGFGWGMVPDLQRTDDLVVLDETGRTDVALHWQRWKVSSTSLDAVTSVILAASPVRNRGTSAPPAG